MEMVVVSLVGEDRGDGTYHVYSPVVPGFHIVDDSPALAYERAIPVLQETLSRRAVSANRKVEVYVPVQVDNFVPDEIRRKFGEGPVRQTERPSHLIAAFM
jgi:hypothetical protein